MEKFLNSYNLSMYLEAFLGNGYDDLKQLTEMSDEELQDVVTDDNMTMKGNVRRFISGVAATKSASYEKPSSTDRKRR